MSQFPKDDLAQLVIATSIAHGVAHVVISPGSRNAPLTIGFSNHQMVKAYSIVDERCAAFFALGMAQQLRQPVAVVCTSGSALLNYAPAVAEAYYSDIPLVVISADRPEHLIDIGDGQTIRQEGVFGRHILSEANLVVASDSNEIALKNTLKKAVFEMGPVHINVPFDEPLYETIDAILRFEKEDLSIEEIPLTTPELEKFNALWNTSSKKMILIGSCFPSEDLQLQIDKLLQDPSVIVLTETHSNIYHPNAINSIDKLIFPISDVALEDLKPELLITLGGMIVSKKVKQFLRSNAPKHHWHIDPKKAFDTFFALSEHIKITPQLFFSQLLFFNLGQKVQNLSGNYQLLWTELKKQRALKHIKYLENCRYSDLKVFDSILKSIPSNSQLQLANSSIVRYAQLFDIDPSLNVFCNRGTSGIDGSTSTAIGASLAVKNQTVFLTGDISFFYDSNALWNAYIRSDFRIIVVNNDGGGIFRFIKGPLATNALEYFETPHGLNANHLCEMYGIGYMKAKSIEELDGVLEDFYSESEVPKLLEIQTPNEVNDSVLKEYFEFLKD